MSGVLKEWFTALRAEGVGEQEAVSVIAGRLNESPAEARRVLVSIGRVKLRADVGRSARKKNASDHARGGRAADDKGRGGIENRGARRRAAVTDIERDLRDA